MNNEVIVTNRNPKIYEDGYGGMKFSFKPNEKVTIPLAAAIHIFGFNKQDKQSTKIRMGIGNHPGGDQFLDNFDLKYVEYVAKDDAAEAEQLKIDLEAKQEEIDDLTEKLDAAQTEIAQLQAKLVEANKVSDDTPSFKHTKK